MGNNEREIIKRICEEQNFDELFLEITSRKKSNKLNKILNDIAEDNRLSKKLRKSIYEDFFEYVNEINQSYIESLKEVFCYGARMALNKINNISNRRFLILASQVKM